MDSYGTINGGEQDQYTENPSEDLVKPDPIGGLTNCSNGFSSINGSIHRRITTKFYRAPEEENEEDDEEDDTEEEEQQRVLSESPSVQNPLQISGMNNQEPPIQDDPDRDIPKQTIGGDEEEDDEEDEVQKRTQKRKSLSCLGSEPATAAKKPKKKNNVWTKSTSRKGKKKSKANANAAEETVYITPVPRFPDKNDDSRDMRVCLSKVYKAEKVELSDDRLTASSCKGYRMVRATRGVVEGAWYFEIKTVKLGDSAHTRLGWSTEKGDLQAPVGYDGNSFAYRDLEGSKVHKAVRESYGEPYYEGDVIGCYINLPEGSLYAPKPPQLVWYKGQRYACAADWTEEPPKAIPGSQISFFKNGTYQGVAFKDLNGGRYFPAASMYTLPYKPSCVVRFNFGPDFEFFPLDFGDHPIPKPMSEAPYHGYDSKVEEKAETPSSNGYLAEKLE